MALFENANYDFIKWRWHAHRPLGARSSSPASLTASSAACRSASTSRAARSSSSKFEQPVTDDQVRRRDCRRSRARTSSRRYGDPAQNQKLIRLPQLGADAEGAALDAERASGRRRADQGEPRQVRSHQPGARRPGDRRRPAAQGHLRHARVDRRHHDLHRRCDSASRSRSARLRRRCTTCSSRSRSCSSSATTCRSTSSRRS